MSRVPISLHYIALLVVPIVLGVAVVHVWGWPLWAGVAIAAATLIGAALCVVAVTIAVGVLIATQVRSAIDEELHPSGRWNHANIEGITDWEPGDRS